MAKFFDWKKFAVVLSLLFMAAYPLVHGNSYIMHLFIVFFLWAVVASNWNLLMGYAGIFSLGNIAFFIMGSYVSGIFAKNLGWSPWLCILLGGLGSMAAVTIFIGLPSLRLSGIYIALWSLVFASALPSSFNANPVTDRWSQRSDRHSAAFRRHYARPVVLH